MWSNLPIEVLSSHFCHIGGRESGGVIKLQNYSTMCSRFSLLNFSPKMTAIQIPNLPKEIIFFLEKFRCYSFRFMICCRCNCQLHEKVTGILLEV